MIRVWGYLDELVEERSAIESAVGRVLESGTLILGEEGKAFEAEFAAYCQAKFGIGVNSGTDALFLGLKALGIGPGDEVITVPNTAIPTVSAIVSTGATPRFVDVDSATFLMDPDLLATQINGRTKCILPVHLYGQSVKIERILAIAAAFGVPVLEDCAQCHGATRNGRMTGSFGVISAFSFYPTKPLGGYGDGGMCLTSDPDLNEKLKRLRFYGTAKTYYAVEHGYNSRLDEIHAAILRAKLKRLESYVQRRRHLAKRYREGLGDTPLILPVEDEANRHVYYVYVVRSGNRDAVIEQLKSFDIHVNVSYPWPIHIMEGYRHLGYGVGDFPVAEKAANDILSLPMYPSLTDGQQDYVIDCVRKIVMKV